jgi:uncharacterized protein (DUF433 family)
VLQKWSGSAAEASVCGVRREARYRRWNGAGACIRQGYDYGPIMSQLQRITFNPEQCGGRPCIRNLRIRVKDMLEMLAAGASEAEILESYPYLERADIEACLEYAARQVDHTVFALAK